MFVNRVQELGYLGERAQARGGELVLLYGRRRVGKSALLREFCAGRAHVYYLASQVREADNLDQFREALAAGHPDPLLDSLRFNSWEAALAYVTRLAARERFVVVLDEFPYLCQGNAALPSLVQRWWDSAGRASHVLLVLCGSQISFMEEEVLAERSPLFGRRTGQIRLGPLLPWEAAQFFPRWSVRERLTAYGVLGGVPAYLERFDPRQSLQANLLREAFRPQGFLYDEVHFLLRTELTQVGTYLSLLKAIAGGATRITEIAARAGLSATTASRYLTTLRALGLVRRDVLFSERQPEKSKRGVYVIGDPFVSFWCRFVLPHQSLIQAGQGEVVWQEFVAPQLDTHLGTAFEEVCRQYVLHRWRERTGNALVRIGRMWSADYDTDVVAELATASGRRTLVAECKWWKSPVGVNVLDDLHEKAALLPADLGERREFALFSLSGFTEALQTAAEEEGVTLVSGAEMLQTEPRRSGAPEQVAERGRRYGTRKR